MAKNIMMQRKDETHLQFRSRVENAKAEGEGRDVLNPFARERGDYVKAFIHHDESGTKAQATLNRGGTTIERWINKGEFEAGALKAIRGCQSLWAAIDHKGQSGRPKVDCGAGDGTGEANALAELSLYKGWMPSTYWSIFEDIARHGSTPESRKARDRAKVVVEFVANIIAMRLNY